MLITECPIGIHAAVQVRTQVPERVCKDGHILRRQETFRGLGGGALEPRRPLGVIVSRLLAGSWE